MEVPSMLKKVANGACARCQLLSPMALKEIPAPAKLMSFFPFVQQNVNLLFNSFN